MNSTLKQSIESTVMSRSKHIKHQALRDELQPIREQNVITLSERDWKRLEEIAADESGPNENLMKAAERYRREVQSDVSGNA
jgi:uncharacterized protein (DUF1778 family)